MRRLLPLVSAIVLIETTFFSALAPLLPDYADALGLSQLRAGILSGAYAAGGLAAALPAGMLASRLGVRPTVLLGLVTMAGTTVTFGFADSEAVLDAARFGQGAGSALAGAGALSWLVAAAPRERRGEVIGIAMGAAVTGALLGPLLGAGAAHFGTEAAFTSVAALACLLGLWAAATPAPPPSGQPLRLLLGAMRDTRVVAGVWLVALPAILLGVITVLGPLSLDDQGWGATGIAAVFLLAAGIEAGVSPLLGRWSDRRGRLAPVRAALLSSAAISLLIPWITGRWAVWSIVLVASVVYGWLWVPGTALISDGAEASGLDQALAFTLFNMAWAPGNVIGAIMSGAIADAGGDGPAYLFVAALCLATYAVLRHRRVVVVAAALIAVLVVTGCGGGAQQSAGGSEPSPAVTSSLLPDLSSRARELDRGTLAKDAFDPESLASLLADAGYVGGSEREFSGRTEIFDHVVVRTLDFGDGSGAETYLGWLEEHADEVLGPVLARSPLDLGEAGFLRELDRCVSCHAQQPTLLAGWREGSRVFTLLAAGAGVDPGSLEALAHRVDDAVG
ncbi:MAG: MFS transporter [Gaiellaceae bacterium]